MKRVLYGIGLLTVLVWVSGFFGLSSNVHTIIVLGLIIVGFVVLLISLTKDDFI